jgi:hypothetical protein
VLSGETTLGGRKFQVVNFEAVTVLNEHYIMKMMRAAGLDTVMPKDEESDEQYLIRMHAALVDTLELPKLLAGYLLPLGKSETDWSLAMAAETQAWIEGLTSPVDKAEVHRMGLMVTFDFFKAGLDSLKHSRNVLAEMAMQSPAEKSSESRSPNAGH